MLTSVIVRALIFLFTLIWFCYDFQALSTCLRVFLTTLFQALRVKKEKKKKKSGYIPTVSENNLVYMQQHMQTARWCQVNAKSKKWRRNLGAYEDVLANQKPEEMWKWLNDTRCG